MSDRRKGILLRIDSSNIGMESARSYSATRMDAYSLRRWSGNGNSLSFQAGLFGQTTEEEVDSSGQGLQTTENQDTEKHDLLSDTADLIRKRYEEMKTKGTSTDKRDQDTVNYIRSQCLDFLFMILWGKKSTTEGLNLYDTGTSSGGGEGGSYSEMHYYEETETTQFSTTGTVKTSDGKEFSFQLSLEMSRSFVEESGIQIDYGSQMCDPLVINLNGTCAGVEDQTFKFDIDADGELDTISRLGRGSGFLALDQNEDGIINDGNELFGTKSGDGFSDLAEYDEDGNGWIDENDAIFDKLLIWIKDKDGKDTLCNLKDKGVGAIYLGNVSSNFSLKDVSNETNAMIRKTGIFLYENGSAGTIQHVDMAKEYAY